MKIGYLRGFETLKERQQLGDLGIDGKKLQLSLISHGSLRGKCGIVSCILGIGPKHRWVHAPVTLTPEEHLLVPARKRGWGGGGVKPVCAFWRIGKILVPARSKPRIVQSVAQSIYRLHSFCFCV